jgi:hypothetical protein
MLGGGGTTGTERTSSSASPEVTTALFPDSIPLCCVLLPVRASALTYRPPAPRST